MIRFPKAHEVLTATCVTILCLLSTDCRQQNDVSAGRPEIPAVVNPQGLAPTALAAPKAVATPDTEVTPDVAWKQNRAQPPISEQPVVRWVDVPELPVSLAIFEDVFWEPDDTVSLRTLIRQGSLVEGRLILEIGTGSGLISLCCLHSQAARVVATDINPLAVRNAVFNAEQLDAGDRFECRLVPRRDPAAWSVIAADETFDIIISNPPWEDRKPTTVAEFALYDPGFVLLKSLIGGARTKLRRGGRMLLAYGCVTAIKKARELADAEKLKMRILDERSLESLPEVFLPGMLIEITVPD